jgi:argininosuccinate lyase
MRDILRGKRLDAMNKEALTYTASIDQDAPLLRSVIMINMAHVISLYDASVLNKEKAATLLGALRKNKDSISLDSRFEDVHMAVEQKVAEAAGQIGGYLNLGKSRNDQVATAIRISLREDLLDILSSLVDLTQVIVEKASTSTNRIIPAYTHSQVAQSTTVAHWLLAFLEMLMRDINRLFECYDRVNLSPMGAAAATGTTVNINRQSTSDYLGFKSIMGNSLDAVSSRDFLLEYMYVLTSIMLTVSRLSEDITFMSNNEVGVLVLPDSYASTSSAMPQKKNSVVTEIARAQTGVVMGNLFSAMSIYKSLPLSYNLDLQEMTPHMWDSSRLVRETIIVMEGIIKELEIDEERSYEVLVKSFCTAMELAEHITVKLEVPFRESHHLVGGYVRSCLERKLSPLSKEAYQIFCEHLQPLKEKPMSYEEYRSILDPRSSISQKTIYGSPNPEVTEKMIIERRSHLAKCREDISEELNRLTNCSIMLENRISEIVGGENL